MPTPDQRHWFEPLAEHMGPAYLRYSFTKGTEQEVDFLVGVLGLGPGHRVLDVGCGPGRHAYRLARTGCEVVGVDISERFVELARADAPAGASFRRLDARDLPFEAEFDAVVCLCQGAFGLAGQTQAPADALAPDREVLAGITRALRSGGQTAVSAFSAYFVVRWLEEDVERFDAATGVNHEQMTVRDEAGAELVADGWTTCFTPRELWLLAEQVGLEPQAVWSVSPGDYARRPPNLDTHEFLLVARRP